MKKEIIRMLTVWTAGLLAIALCFLPLLVTGRIRIKGYGNLLCLAIKKIIRREKRTVVLYFRHSSLAEPIFLAFLFYPFSLFHPAFIPYCFVEKQNYYDQWWYTPLRPVSETIERGNYRKAREASEKMERIAKKGRISIIAPGGGRELNGKRWKVIRNGRIEKTDVWREEEMMIRTFQSGIYHLWKKTDVVFLPVSTRGGEGIIPNKENYPSGKARFSWPRIWRRMDIVIGRDFELKRNISRAEFFDATENTLLTLGDKGNRR